MEVHHHPHVEKKNFKEYFLEFLMIFLAVTLGFFAESVRERLVNSEKEEHYMKDLIADLSADTANFSRVIKYQNLYVEMLDSALKIPIGRLGDINMQDTFFHETFLYYSLVPAFTPRTNAISQLKAGGFNVMRDEKVIDSIHSLYQFYELVDFDTKYDETTYWDAAHKMQSLMHLPAPAESWSDPAIGIIPAGRKIFFTNDSVAIAQLYNILGNSLGSLKTCVDFEIPAQVSATNLIRYLKQQYNIK